MKVAFAIAQANTASSEIGIWNPLLQDIFPYQCPGMNCKNYQVGTAKDQGHEASLNAL